MTTARLLTGRVMHERLRPAHHRFDYPVCYVECDVAGLDALQSSWFGIDRTRLFALFTRDHGPRDGSNLEHWMRARLAEAGIPADGVIRLLTIPRVLGRGFNPVSFWFCHDRAGALRALYADVRNTFGERRGYLLSAPDHAVITAGTELTCRKTLHVSPFCDVTGDYTFRVRRRGAHLSLAIDYRDPDGLLIRTALGLDARPLTAALAWRTLLRQPLLAAGVIVRIHWQALRLWLKRVPFHGRHPPSQADPNHTNESNNKVRS
ncbi:DUF1365 domain-containing protein [Caballeronia sp. LZ043]|uniref:DUF1365 domain-containing protein n=1 Tax=Caballeronia sp. LZ043 TaxID=3038569 RepID=UPI0028620F58|nr:DUF1365 domain-containing protein [Caballeronia sp. LZ043]MDR5822850.1 DUF1365 domain-containing protein [Caballeronia sp. LZ043]